MGIITRGAMRSKRPRITWGTQTGHQISVLHDLQFADLAALDAAHAETNTIGPGATWAIDFDDPYGGLGGSVALDVVGGSIGSPLGGPGKEASRSVVFSGFTPGEVVTLMQAVKKNTDPYGAGISVGFYVDNEDATSEDYAEGTPKDCWFLTGGPATVRTDGTIHVRYGAFELVAFIYDSHLHLGPIRARQAVTSGADTGLLFAEPLDRAVAFTSRAPDSARVKNVDSSDETIWHLGTDDILQGLARWIPIETGTDRYGTTSTGWHGTDGTDGWRSFLEYARDGRPFTFWSDRDDDEAPSYECVLVEPMRGAPSTEGNRHYQTPFAIRSLSGPFVGY